MPRQEARRPAALAALAAALTALVVTQPGCDELKSRHEIQQANKLYVEGRYRDAAKEYEQALALTPDLDVGQHNAGLAYYKLFQPGVESPANTAYAEKSANHLQAYLKDNPKDEKIIGLLTTLWLDSGQYQKALAYWEGVLAKNPDNRDVLEKLANINRQAGQYDKALEWHTKRAELETDPGAKAKAYLDIGQMEWSRLVKSDLVDEERIQVADTGLAALQRAAKIDPSNPLVESLTGSLYQFRALAHQASWARAVESASQRFHQVRFTQLKKAQVKKAAQGAPSASATPPAPK